MSNKPTIQNTTHAERGAALLTFVIFFLLASTILVFGITRGVYQSLVEYRLLTESKRSFYAVEAGIEDAIYRHRDSKAYSGTESFVFDGITVNVVRTLVVDTYQFTVVASSSNATRRDYLALAVGDGASFSFGMQSGNGGITMLNSSSITGNLFSNGPITASGNTIRGDVISAGPSGLVDTVNATGSVWAHTIQSIVGTLVSGSSCVNANCHPGSTDQATITMPIPDALIEDWKTDITNTGTIISSTSTECSSGTYTIDTDTTLNNIRIDCNLDVSKNSTNLTIAGPVWVKGNLSFSQGPVIIASSSLGTRSVQVIVDSVTSRATSSKVSVNQSTNFTSGNAQSYVVIISMNNSAETGGTVKAIDLGQTTTGKLLVYAAHGLIDIGQSTSLKEITGYQIRTQNSSTITYESGLMNLLFTGGPGGGYTISDWKEIQ
jgi:hypothetical protein